MMWAGCKATFALVLGGGNALGSYQAGVYQALHEHGVEPDWIVGTSAGAINGALIAGNAPEDRIGRLREFWRPARGSFWWEPFWGVDTVRRSAAVMSSLLGGRAGVFSPIGTPGSLWWDHDAAAAAPSIFDTRPLEVSLERLVDFDRLNSNRTRFTACAVNLDTAEEVLFDTAHEKVSARHIRASAALLPCFPPVEIAGRAYVDGGVSANLPLDPVLSEPAAGSTLCIAVDLLPGAGTRPATLGESAGRLQDLVFAAQSRRTIERWQTAYEVDERLRSRPVVLARLAYSDQQNEVAGKAMDFSPESVTDRWAAGVRDANKILAALDRLEPGTGLTILAEEA